MKLSNTCQRRVIMEELRKLKCHPTADELYCIVKQRLPKISLATVYRNRASCGRRRDQADRTGREAEPL